MYEIWETDEYDYNMGIRFNRLLDRFNNSRGVFLLTDSLRMYNNGLKVRKIYRLKEIELPGIISLLRENVSKLKLLVTNKEVRIGLATSNGVRDIGRVIHGRYIRKVEGLYLQIFENDDFLENLLFYYIEH